MENISLVISPRNECNEKQQIMIRKFFNMIFIGIDGFTLHVYTAIIFSSGVGGSANPLKYIPAYESNRLNLKFKFSGVEKIRFSNVSSSLFRQPHCLQRIWGECKSLEETEVQQKLSEIYSASIKHNIEILSSTLFINDPNESKLHTCIVQEGDYHQWEAEKYFTVAEANESVGIEYLNWVKTEIQLSYPIINDKINFTIKFDIPKNVVWYCPDYMWYICTPEELMIDLSDTYVGFGDKATIPNLMQSLAQGTAVQFCEWVAEESINKCKRYRLKFEGQKAPSFEKKSHISVSLSILKLRDKHSNRQFLTGLLVAFLLAYVSDWTRLSELHKSIWGQGQSPNYIYVFDLLFPFSIILIYLSIIVPLAHTASGMKKGLKNIVRCSKCLGISFSVFSISLFFLVLPISKLCGVSIPDLIKYGMVFVSGVLGLIGTIFYIGFSFIKKKVDLYDYL